MIRNGGGPSELDCGIISVPLGDISSAPEAPDMFEGMISSVVVCFTISILAWEGVLMDGIPSDGIPSDGTPSDGIPPLIPLDAPVLYRKSKRSGRLKWPVTSSVRLS